MDKELYSKVSLWFDQQEENIVRDIMRLVRVESISMPGADGTPFGRGCLRALEEMLQIGREHGFDTENYDNIVGSIGTKEKHWDNLIGFWNHLDVVPVGNDWRYAPFEPVRKEHFLIGRGTQDNKGPAVGILYMMQCIRELNIPMNHELCLFVGTDEERGMEDLEYYKAHYPTPKLSMIADSGFPVCYGEKGIIEGRMISDSCVSGDVLEVKGGSASNMIPDRAEVLLKKSEALAVELKELLGEPGKLADIFSLAGNEGQEVMEMQEAQEAQKVPARILQRISWEVESGGIRVIAKGTSKHSAFPKGSVNAIHELSVFLQHLTRLSESDKGLFAAVERLSEEYYGENPGIAYEDEVSGRTTCAATVLTLEQGYLCLTLNIRYAITARDEENLQTLKTYAEKNHLRWELERNSKPNYFPKEHPAVDLLTDLFNEITGRETKSFVMGGGTYARMLPNAFAYGVGGMVESDEDREIKARLFEPGHGGAHEPDEALNLRLLLEAMKIYTMAVVELNSIEL